MRLNWGKIQSWRCATGLTGTPHHGSTQHSVNSASLCKQISLPSLENFYIQRRNSKSSDVNRKGMGEFLGLRDRWNFEKLYFKSLSIFRFVLREMDMYSHFVKCCKSHLGFGSVMPVPASRYLVSAASNLTKASADTRACWGLRRQHLSVSWGKIMGYMRFKRKTFMSNGWLASCPAKCSGEHVQFFLEMFCLYLQQ